MKNNKKILSTTISTGLILSLTGCGVTTNEISTCIENNDFKGAYDFYTENIVENKKQSELESEIVTIIEEKLSTIEKSYSEENIKSSDIGFLKKLASEIGMANNKKYKEFLDDLDVIDFSIESFNTAENSFKKEDYKNALYYYNNIPEIDISRYKIAQDKIAEIGELLEKQKEEEIKKEIENVRKLIESGNYSDAKEKIKLLIAYYGENDEITKLNDEIKNKELNDAKKLIEDKKYTEAKNMIDSLTSTYGESTEISLLTENLKAAISAQIDDKVQASFEELNYKDAYDYVKGIYDTYHYDELEKRLENLKNEFAEYALTESEAKASEGKYEAASSIVEKALDVMEDNETLINAYNEYRSHLPMYIIDYKIMSKENGVKISDGGEDNVGNLYHNSLFMSRDLDTLSNPMVWYGKGAADYFIQSKYTKFTGTVAVANGYSGSNYTAYFEVYGDGELLYTSPVMDKTSLPEEFSIDISGVELLTISYPETNKNAEMATIYDGTLIPKEDKKTEEKKEDEKKEDKPKDEENEDKSKDKTEEDTSNDEE